MMNTHPSSFPPMSRPSHTLPSDYRPGDFPIAVGIPDTPLRWEANLPFTLECQGTSWKGIIRQWSLSQLNLIIDGYPWLMPDQPIHLQIGSCFEGHGKICPGWTTAGRSPQLRYGLPISISLEALSAQQRHDLNTVLTNAERQAPPPTMHIRAKSSTPEGCLWEMTSGMNQWAFIKKHTPSAKNPNPPTITSTPIHLNNVQGQRLVASLDSPASHQSDSPLVIMAPGYGETKREYIPLAYYLASNGCRVLRYDHTNHVGESEGEHCNVTLSSMHQDLDTVMRYAQATWPNAPTIMLASSLAGRVALKSAPHHPHLKAVILLVGVVDVQHSLKAVHQEDLFTSYLEGGHPSMANVLGLNVRDRFLADALDGDFATFESTLHDVKHIQAPVIFFAAEHDAWVQPESIRQICTALPPRQARCFVVPQALHRLQENPRNARMVYRQVVASCRQYTHRGFSHRTAVTEPSRRAIGLQNRLERDEAKNHESHNTALGSDFWTDYLANFHSIGMCPDYLTLLDHVFRMLGPIRPGTRLLDAGCGNGQVGMFFLLTQLKNRLESGEPAGAPIYYTGVDFVAQALAHAQTNLARSLEEFRTALGLDQATSPPIHCSLAQTDLNHPLPFPENRFDRIVCNLVIGYLEQPRFTLRELFRVLAPGGKLVITNLKPEGDFSGIYRNIVEHPNTHDVRREAKELLNNYGKIKLAEKNGQFQFFGKRQWMEAIRALGCREPKIFPTFANQAFLVVLEKPASLASPPLADKTMAPSHPFQTITDETVPVAA